MLLLVVFVEDRLLVHVILCGRLRQNVFYSLEANPANAACIRRRNVLMMVANYLYVTPVVS